MNINIIFVCLFMWFVGFRGSGTRSLGYGFVEMKSAELAQKAIEQLHRSEVDGRIVSVEVFFRKPSGVLRGANILITFSFLKRNLFMMRCVLFIYFSDCQSA